MKAALSSEAWLVQRRGRGVIRRARDRGLRLEGSGLRPADRPIRLGGLNSSFW